MIKLVAKMRRKWQFGTSGAVFGTKLPAADSRAPTWQRPGVRLLSEVKHLQMRPSTWQADIAVARHRHLPRCEQL